MSDHWWGLQPPEAVTVAWGARAILGRNGQVDVLWDRQSTIGNKTEPMELKALTEWLNEKGLRLLKAAVEEDPPSPSGHSTIKLMTTKYTIEASPRGSYGYLYIGAWKTP